MTMDFLLRRALQASMILWLLSPSVGWGAPDHELHAFHNHRFRTSGHLVSGHDGLLWGSSFFSPTNETAGDGMIFSLNPATREFRIVLSFTNEALPRALTLLDDGSLVTCLNDDTRASKILRVTTNGVRSTIWERDTTEPSGFNPVIFAPLLAHPDGFLYTTVANQSLMGALVRWSRSGRIELIAKVNAPSSAPILMPDGSLYWASGVGGGHYLAGTATRIGRTVADDGPIDVAGVCVAASDGGVWCGAEGWTGAHVLYHSLFRFKVGEGMAVMHVGYRRGPGGFGYGLAQRKDGAVFGLAQAWLCESYHHGDLNVFRIGTNGILTAFGPTSIRGYTGLSSAVVTTNGECFAFVARGGRFDQGAILHIPFPDAGGLRDPERGGGPVVQERFGGLGQYLMHRSQPTTVDAWPILLPRESRTIRMVAGRDWDGDGWVERVMRADQDLMVSVWSGCRPDLQTSTVRLPPRYRPVASAISHGRPFLVIRKGPREQMLPLMPGSSESQELVTRGWKSVAGARRGETEGILRARGRRVQFCASDGSPECHALPLLPFRRVVAAVNLPGVSDPVVVTIQGRRLGWGTAAGLRDLRSPDRILQDSHRGYDHIPYLQVKVVGPR